MDLSVIIPTLNRSGRLRELLQALSRQIDVPFKWEVLVVDNGSKDETRTVALEKLKSSSLNIIYLYEPTPGLHHSRHCGALAAKGEYLAFLDDDVLPDPRWILALQGLIVRKAQAMGGPVLPFYSSPPPAWADSFWMPCSLGKYCFPLSVMDLGAKTLIPISPYFIYGCNLFIQKKTLFDLGGFHPDAMPSDQLRFRGDGETGLMMHFENYGLVALYSPQAKIYHIVEPERLTIDYFCRRYFIQGISDSYTQIRKSCGKHFKEPHFTIPSHVSHHFRAVWNKVSQSYIQGWQYHQKEVKQDLSLLHYVLKPNYFEM
jgi:glycosyltransferase involved in cell wall biosynthesis